MKTINNVTLYKCDFCKKELKRKHAMKTHEKKCTNNPLNHRACLFGCIHLTRREIEYEIGQDDSYTSDPILRKKDTFYCELKKQFMLHPKLEHREDGKFLKKVYHNNEEVEQDWMPIKCSDFYDVLFF